MVLDRLLGGLRGLFHKKQVEQDLDEELRDYLESAAEKKISAGMSREDALRSARVEMGSPEAVKDQVREVGWESLVEMLWQDGRYAVRRLTKSPGFTAAAIVTLGLGIGANIAIFTLMYQVLIKPLPYKDPAQLVALWGDASYRGVPRSEPSPADFRDWRQQATTFSNMAAYIYGGVMTVSAQGGAQLIDIRQVEANFFQVLGVEPYIGRAFLTEEDDAGARRVAVISHAFWQSHFGGQENLEGAVVQEYAVVGVMPQGFQFGMPNTDAWVPLMLSDSEWANRGNYMLQVVGRLKPGVSITEAQAEMDSIAANLSASYPSTNASRGVRVRALRDEFSGSVRTTYFILFAAAACVLLVACLNVANLLLLRGARRQRELAVRASLGASRARLAQQLLTESALLALAGSLVGLIISRWTFSFFAGFVPDSMDGLTELKVTGPVLGFTAAVALLTACLAGLTPALRLSSLQLSGTMREGGRSGIARGGRRLRNALVVCEIAVAVVLLVCSSLFIGTLMRLYAVDPGFDTTNLLTAELRVRRADYYDAVLERVTALPGVTSAGLATVRPLTPYPGRRALSIEGHLHQDSADQPRALFRTISSGYLETLKVPLLRGRMLDDQDRMGSQPVALINESMRRRCWADRDPIGLRVKQGALDSDNAWYTVVGVVGDVKQAALDVEPEPELMLPYLQYDGAAFYSPGHLVVRTAVNLAGLADVIRGEIEAVDPTVPVAVLTMEQVGAQGLDDRQPRTVLITGFAALALVLSILGVYALVSFAVADRTQEIGVRLALGAHPGLVVRMIVKEGMALAAIGCTAGLMTAAALTWTIEGFLWGVTPTEPESFAVVALLTLLTAVVASYVPARRVTKINPVAALRYE